MSSDAMPTEFDRTLAALTDLPDVVQTKESIIRAMPFLGVGGSTMFVVKTVRQKDDSERPARDTIFLELVKDNAQGGAVRLVLPPEVAALIHRQYDALTSKTRKKGARRAAETRKALGIVPNFKKKAKA